MKKKEKLNLIDNYVEIHKIIFNCKQVLTTCKAIQDINKINELIQSTLKLKDLYEKTFEKNKMMNDSLILLKMQLNEALVSTPQVEKNFSLDNLISKRDLIESDLKNII